MVIFTNGSFILFVKLYNDKAGRVAQFSKISRNLSPVSRIRVKKKLRCDETHL
jgi:predicted transcriptional regulator